MNPDKFGYLIEGVVEQDPMTDRYVIRTVDANGKSVTFDPIQALASMTGKDVRFTIASFDALAELAAMVEEAGKKDVMGLQPPRNSDPTKH